jgi:hypothetical protein
MLTIKNYSLIFLLFAILFSTSGDAAELKINRINIYFSNDRPEITVKRNYPLKVYAEIGYTGAGILEGHWEADEEFLTNVTRTISSGDRLVIDSPDIPRIPTFVSGTHRVRFVITNPFLVIKFPFATYFVTTDEWENIGERTNSRCGKEPAKNGE